VGNFVQFGSQGIVVAVLFPAKKSLILVRRLLALKALWSAIVQLFKQNSYQLQLALKVSRVEEVQSKSIRLSPHNIDHGGVGGVNRGILRGKIPSSDG
jgi:hypothetical protein